MLNSLNSSVRVSFQGMLGAYSNEALNLFFKDKCREIQPVPCSTPQDLANTIINNTAEFAILPVENSIAGNVNSHLELLLTNPLFAIGEIYLPINHSLLALPGVSIKDISHVYSHPMAIDQCQSFISDQSFKSIPCFDTAGSAHDLVKRSDSTGAAIASSFCASIYNLEILAQSIQDTKQNITRFLILTHQDKIPDYDKSSGKVSLAFSSSHKSGALLQALQIFSNFDLNLTRLLSKPNPSNPFEYIFFVDFIGDLENDNVISCLTTLKDEVKYLKILGNYPAAENIV